MRRQRAGYKVTELGNWDKFVILFGQMFGLHYETIQAQSKLDECNQVWNELFGDFWVRFEDIALMTDYDDRALRWRLLKQFQNNLRNRLVDHGEIPETLAGVVDKLLVLDGAKQAFNQIGLSPKPNNNRGNWYKPNDNNTPKQENTAPNNPQSSNNTHQNSKFNVRTPTAQQAAMDEEQEHLEAVTLEDNNNSEIKTPEKDGTYPRVPQAEWNRRMKEGLCAICACLDHRYRQHWRRNPPNAAVQGTFLEEHDAEEELYVEIDGLDQPVHIDDPILTMLEDDFNSGN
ncbi:hypothetical protein F5880DRAFT_1615650 [Lentinula raphanica]|nr:hypothetical protein F5880DRAFT_1615650 [Lentinula raphanica]